MDVVFGACDFARISGNIGCSCFKPLIQARETMLLSIRRLFKGFARTPGPYRRFPYRCTELVADKLHCFGLIMNLSGKVIYRRKITGDVPDE